MDQTGPASQALQGVASGQTRPRSEGSTVADDSGSKQQQNSNQNQPFVASTAPLTFTDFLEKMRAPAAMDLVRGIKSFISEMLKSSSNAEADGQKVQDFLARSEDAFRSHPLWIDSSLEEFEAAGEGLEKYLLTKLYSRCFGVAEEDKERDDLLNQRMKALGNFIKPQHLDIPDKYCNESSWTLAQKELQKINTYKAPRDKLVCILNCCRVISNLLSTTEEGAGADDFLPILIYVLILAAPPQLESNLAFIMRYRLASRLNGEAAYFYTNMVSATTFIETIEPNSLSIDPNEFIAHMQAAGVPGSEDPTVAKADEGNNIPPLPPMPEEPPKQEESSTATTSNLIAVQQGKEERRLSNPSSGPSRRSSSKHDYPPLAVVEERGSSMLLEAEGLGELHMRYKFLYASLSDMQLKDVKVLLDDYKEIALKYESLSRGYKLICEDLSSAQTPVPKLVKAFHRVDAMNDSNLAGDGNHLGSNNSAENLIRLMDSPALNNSITGNGASGSSDISDGKLPNPPIGTSSSEVVFNNPVGNTLPTPPANTNSSPLPDLLG